VVIVPPAPILAEDEGLETANSGPSQAAKAQGKKKQQGKAHRGLALIQKLYRVEKQARKLTPEERHAHRQRHARPILDELRTWLDAALPQVPPTRIDNNGAENAIRPFVVGRKNWLFSTSVKGVNASANLYSLIETAKVNGLEPYAYLRHLFTELPKVETVEAIEALLPGNLSAGQIRLS
jgi:transposase